MAVLAPAGWRQTPAAVRRRSRGVSSGGGKDEAATQSAAHREGLIFLERLRADAPGIREDFLSNYGALVRFAMNSVLRQKGLRLEQSETEELFHAILLSFFEENCRRLKMYEGRAGASFATFVRVCATRQCLDFARRQQRQPTFVADSPHEGGPGILEGLVDASAGPEEQATAREQVRQLQTLIASLPTREQVLIRLHFVEGQAIPIVARTLGITDNAAHVLKSRLRTKLRQQIEWDEDV